MPSDRSAAGLQAIFAAGALSVSRFVTSQAVLGAPIVFVAIGAFVVGRLSAQEQAPAWVAPSLVAVAVLAGAAAHLATGVRSRSINASLVVGDRSPNLVGMWAHDRARRLRDAMSLGRHALFELNLHDRSIVLGEGANELLEICAPVVTHLNVIDDAVDANDLQQFRAAYRLMEAGLALSAYGDLKIDGREQPAVWVHYRLEVCKRTANGAPQHLLVAATDISERKHRELRLEHLAMHDPLTGLPNRAAFVRHDNRAPANALLLIDLDEFKSINDRLGHLAGDAWLIEVAERLRRAVRGDDFVARLGGDEFVVLPSGKLARDALDQLARRLVTCLAEPFLTAGGTIYNGASVGLAYRNDCATAVGADLFAAADHALQNAKQAGRNRFAVAPCEREMADADGS